MKSLPRIILFLVLLAGGIIIGRTLATTEVDEDHVTHQERKPARPRGEMSRTYTTLANRVKTNETAPTGLQAAIAKVDTATLKSIVLEQYHILAEMTEGGKTRQPHQDLYTTAMEEIWNRDQLAAFEWADTLENPKERAMMHKSLLRRALKEDLEGALPWMEKYHAENGKSETYGEFRTTAMKAAVDRGADAVIRAFNAFPEAGRSAALRDMDFPEDFDFAKLHQEIGTKLEMTNVFAQWAIRDRDAAWAALEKNMESQEGYPLGDIGEGFMKAVMVTDGESTGITWILDKLSTAPKVDESNYDRLAAGLIPDSDLSPEGIGLIASRLSPESRRSTARDTLLYHSHRPSTAYFLATLPRNELIEVFRKSERLEYRSDPAEVEQSRRTKEYLYQRLELTPAELAEIKVSGAEQ